MPHRLLAVQKQNIVFRRLQDRGVDTSQFRWTNAPHWKYSTILHSKLEHKEREIYFFFMTCEDGSKYVPAFAPGPDTPICSPHDWDSAFIDDGCEWGMVESYVAQWADIVREELEAGDLWATLRADKQQIQSTFEQDSSNEMFTAPEKETLKTSLKRVEEQILNLQGITSDLQKEMRARFIYANEAMDRVGRKDWKLILYASVVQFLIDAAAPTEVKRNIFMIVISTIFKVLAGMVGYDPK